ncbi:hypothetical protein P7K49_018125 [Saguinus oedipus]|uniref:Uncharacterized protein n=1 Tax=Saguinus oedipus TaxID=9490 RepID=A0ABQ9V4H0_SAGOE|nr:hypothetical protein P7K49_018125 [Saguinus oedipus]
MTLFLTLRFFSERIKTQTVIYMDSNPLSVVLSVPYRAPSMEGEHTKPAHRALSRSHQEIEQNSAMAPRKRGGRGISFIFCCFRNNDHPEITYRLRNDSNFALQTMEPALPMPPVEELDVMFSELVVVREDFLEEASCQQELKRANMGPNLQAILPLYLLESISSELVVSVSANPEVTGEQKTHGPVLGDVVELKV